MGDFISSSVDGCLGGIDSEATGVLQCLYEVLFFSSSFFVCVWGVGVGGKGLSFLRSVFHSNESVTVHDTFKIVLIMIQYDSLLSRLNQRHCDSGSFLTWYSDPRRLNSSVSVLSHMRPDIGAEW